MEIGFYGAACEVTGSKHIVRLSNGLNFLLDCGLFQGGGDEIDAWNTNFSFQAKEIDFVLLSHAHIDHSGLLPKLVKEGFEGKIYATKATKELCEIMLEDSARIQEADIRFVNKKRQSRGQKLLEPLYDTDDVKETVKLFEIVKYGVEFQPAKDIIVRYEDAGHIIGSAWMHISINEGEKNWSLAFSGDIGRATNRILKAPTKLQTADIIICESTYGGKSHDKDPNLKESLREIVWETCVTNQGKLIIPAFSVGRTQEIISSLNDLHFEGRLPRVPVYVDSPLSKKATQVVEDNEECFNSNMIEFMKLDPDPFGFKGLHFTEDKADSKELNESKEPSIIISASGMAEAGRVKHHLLHTISNRKNAVLFVGYCSPYSLGGKLLNGDGEVKIFTELLPVRAKIYQLNGFSAHADQNELLDFLDLVS